MRNKSDLITVSRGGRRQMIKARIVTVMFSGDLQVISGDQRIEKRRNQQQFGRGFQEKDMLLGKERRRSNHFHFISFYNIYTG